ncbi:hypothetical protein CTI12_AA204950 [Artemisia annua]|uniref:Uncharacterized protein n=1 Tax=Artemisia annua TaxID=35608 RepID=A0A2U1P1C7_ARTAN|nr:hypothetical protein CTI12_AA204950 [Artemisia annua]
MVNMENHDVAVEDETNAMGKLVLVGEDGVPLKPVKVDSQATILGPFPSLSYLFSSPNTSAKVGIAGDESNGMGTGSYDA